MCINKNETKKHRLKFTEREIALLYDLVDDKATKMVFSHEGWYDIYSYEEINELMGKLESIDIDYFTIKGIDV